MASFLISNDGPHSPDDWAIATAEEIFALDPSLVAGRLLEAKRIQLAIASLLSPIHAAVMSKEKEALCSNPDHCDNAHEIGDMAHEAVNEIAELARRSPWGNLLNSNEWQVEAIAALSQHLITAIHIERLWHADRNPENAAAQSYKAKYHG